MIQLFGLVLLLSGILLIVVGYQATVSPDLSFSRAIIFEKDEDVFGKRWIVYLVRIMGVILILVGLLTSGIGLLGVSSG